MAKILRTSEGNNKAQFLKASAFAGQNLILCHILLTILKMEFKLKLTR